MAFFTFAQNNSGGVFNFDEASGVTHYVVIEAGSGEEANWKAEALGVYFDGCDTGQDCSCCGDRWYAMGEGDKGDLVPSLYHRILGTPKTPNFKPSRWMPEGKEFCIHYADGRKDWMGADA